MKAPIPSNLACRYCQYYSPEGRRGGECQRLNVHVQGEWAACALMTPKMGLVGETIEELPKVNSLQTEPQSVLPV